MEARASPLGRTGVSFSKFCLSAMMFGAWGNPDHMDSIRIAYPSIHSGSDGMRFKENGDLVIVFGPTAPAEDADNWIQTVPAKGWFRSCASTDHSRPGSTRPRSPEKSNPSADESVIWPRW